MPMTDADQVIATSTCAACFGSGRRYCGYTETCGPADGGACVPECCGEGACDYLSVPLLNGTWAPTCAEFVQAHVASLRGYGGDPRGRCAALGRRLNGTANSSEASPHEVPGSVRQHSDGFIALMIAAGVVGACCALLIIGVASRWCLQKNEPSVIAPASNKSPRNRGANGARLDMDEHVEEGPRTTVHLSSIEISLKTELDFGGPATGRSWGSSRARRSGSAHDDGDDLDFIMADDAVPEDAVVKHDAKHWGGYSSRITFEARDLVQVHGLQSDLGQSLNGHKGRIVKYLAPTDRYHVVFGRTAPLDEANVKPEHLFKVSGAAAEIEPATRATAKPKPQPKPKPRAKERLRP